jgi:class III poly(R)-hydroxyalkanoic acid synthase PhaE subunit
MKGIGVGDLNKMAEQFWQSAGEFGKAWTSQAKASGSPWHEGLEQFARLFKPAEAGEVFDQMLGQGKQYLAGMEQLFKAASNPSADALKDFFAQSLSQMQAQKPWFAGLGDSAAWFAPEQLAPLMHALQFDPKAMLSMPALGLMREHQERAQQLLAHMLDYQREMAAYNALMSKSLEAAVKRMESKIAERSEPGRELTSAKALYDLWIDALEEAYAEIALSDEFKDVYGRLVDAQMRVRAGVQQVVEKSCADLGMPTRTEMNSAHKKVTELRRELRALDLDAVDELRSELAALRAEVARLKSSDKAEASASRVSLSKRAKAEAPTVSKSKPAVPQKSKTTAPAKAGKTFSRLLKRTS